MSECMVCGSDCGQCGGPIDAPYDVKGLGKPDGLLDGIAITRETLKQRPALKPHAWQLVDAAGMVIMSRGLTEGREVVIVDVEDGVVFVNRE